MLRNNLIINNSEIVVDFQTATFKLVNCRQLILVLTSDLILNYLEYDCLLLYSQSGYFSNRSDWSNPEKIGLKLSNEIQLMDLQ